MINKNYIVYGSKGYLGSNIVTYLKKKKCRITLPKKNQFLNKKGIVIYCIGSDDWFGDPFKSYESNFIHLYKLLKNYKNFESLVFLSSTRVYLDLNKKKVDEKQNLILNSSGRFKFNLQKLMCENFLLSQNKNIKIIRLSNVYGKNTFQKTFLPSLIRNSVKSKKINIRLNVNSSKDYIYIDDAVRNIFNLANKKEAKGIYNLAYGKNFKVKDIIKIINKETDCAINYFNSKNLEKFPEININKLKKTINFTSKVNLIKMLPKLIEAEKKCS